MVINTAVGSRCRFMIRPHEGQCGLIHTGTPPYLLFWPSSYCFVGLFSHTITLTATDFFFPSISFFYILPFLGKRNISTDHISPKRHLLNRTIYVVIMDNEINLIFMSSYSPLTIKYLMSTVFFTCSNYRENRRTAWNRKSDSSAINQKYKTI